ncbi:hypothetical protein ACHRVW_03395 [Flavobacterium collinsii]|jgi:hypothetical protein|uniref:Uncharacterized protein n=1 Tax=Flavobacterium collinsii TaxID=1114861 RepID=A0ABM8KM15_9FLAO|nr:hypothetical protein [Flavobacterium collinsii]CAA9200426.1 hypothetical protein FLACOL7796_03237 [Flavobacterium collinsii]
MNSILKIIKATFLGGIPFLCPLISLLVLLEKSFSITVHSTKVKFPRLVIEEIAVFIYSATGSQLFVFDS